MFEKNIKPIPKYIIARIKRKDKQTYYYHTSNTRFYGYYTTINKELCEVTVAVRNSHKKWYCKQVVVHTVESRKCYVKDIELYLIAGYVVGWYNEGLTRYKKYYEGKDWEEVKDNYFNLYPSQVNLDYLLSKEKYKYSAIDIYPHYDKLKYLRLYAKYPQMELLTKLGFNEFATKKTILQRVSKDEQFRKWLISNRNTINGKSKYYYASTILLAYSKNMNIEKAQKLEEFKKTIIHEDYYKDIKRVFKGDFERFFDYIRKQDTNTRSYHDYLTACEFIGLDMAIDKNLTPHNFKRWHDIRIDEYHSKKAELDKKQKKQLYKNFEKIADKYIKLERTLTKDDYICIIAKSPQQLVYEGEVLSHCVGSMNYDQKFIKEESLIFFIRNKLAPNTPLVTLEYSPTNHKILQCYGEHDSRPNEQILDFVNQKWLPYANRKLRQLAV